MSDLPAGWELVQLQDLAAPEPRSITDGPFGSNLKTAHYTDVGPRVLRLQNIGFGEFIDEYAHISDEHFESLRNHEVRAGDLVIASLGENLPRSCVVPPSVGPAIVKADCIRVRLHADIDARYVNYALQRPELKSVVVDQIHGVGRPRLGMVGIKALSIPVAPKAEQERIVASIEEHVSRIDAAASSLRSAVERINLFLRASRSEAFARCALTPLDSIASTQLGKMLSEKSRTGIGSTPYLRNRNVRWGTVDLTDVAVMDFTDAEVRRFQLVPGDVLICEGGAGVGRTGIWRGELQLCCFQKALHRVSTGPDLLPEILVQYMRHLVDTRGLERHLSGVAIGHLPQEDLRRLPVPAMPLGDQEALAADLQRCELVLNALRRDIGVALRRADSLRRSLLTAAFSGRLVAQEESDEPASALLQRIDAERPARSRKRQVAS